MNQAATKTHTATRLDRRRRHRLRWFGLALLATVALPACNQNPFMPPQTPGAIPPAVQGLQPNQAQLYDLDRRASSLDANNRDLHTQLAQSRQQVQLLREQVSLLQKELADSAKRLQETQIAKTEADKRAQALEAAATRRGGAIITANNSQLQPLRKADIEGLEVRQDGDTIRIELPTDQLFSPGTAQLLGSAFPILDRVASELTRNYPRQLMGIEGHTDSAPAYGGASNHQLAAAQALAIFDQLTRRNRLPANQFTLAALGANKPLTSNSTQAGRAKNRRIELVVYPETLEAQ
jgi:flagellar motor protein MotB